MSEIPRDAAIAEMTSNGARIRAWAVQQDNLVLQQLAKEVLKAAGEPHAKK